MKPDIAMENLQKHFSRLAGHLSLDPMNRDVVGVLIEILEEAMDRLTADSNTDRPFVMLPLEIARLDGEYVGSIVFQIVFVLAKGKLKCMHPVGNLAPLCIKEKLL